MRTLNFIIVFIIFLSYQFVSAQIDFENKFTVHRTQINNTSQFSLNTPYTVKEMERDFISLQSKNSKLIVLIIIITFLFSIFTFTLYTSQQKHIKRLEISIQQKKLYEQPCDKKEIEIEESIVHTILTGLKEFETELGFLEHGVSLISLSKKINTNPTYLSKIINSHKEKKVSDYLSDLRVNYLLSALKTDPKLSLYTMKAIAYEIGFSNSQSFTNAFYKKTGMYPSRYIRELKVIRLKNLELST